MAAVKKPSTHYRPLKRLRWVICLLLCTLCFRLSKWRNVFAIWCSQGGWDDNVALLGCDAFWTRRYEDNIVFKKHTVSTSGATNRRSNIIDVRFCNYDLRIFLRTRWITARTFFSGATWNKFKVFPIPEHYTVLWVDQD